MILSDFQKQTLSQITVGFGQHQAIYSCLFPRFGRKKGVIVPMLLASFGAIGAVLLTTDDESNTGNKEIDSVYMIV